MVSIRLARTGAKKRPFYHIVVTNSRSARGGRFIERVGFFNPVAQGAEAKLQVDGERVKYWLSQGAQPSERVDQLLKSQNQSQAAA
jgi:small subunit ribosomal protein S16